MVTTNLFLLVNMNKPDLWIINNNGKCTVSDTEFRASFCCHFKKLRCKSLFIVNVTFKSQILKLIFYHLNRMSIKIVANGKIEVNNVKRILHFLTVY
jgi:hypothetical protein